MMGNNQIADETMQRRGIPVDDLYTLVQRRLTELQLTNDVHFKDKGYAV